MTGLKEATADEVEIIKIFGGPGTGKTTTLVGNTDIEDFKGILERMFEERHYKELMLIAYTRSAADEALGRLTQLTSLNKKKLDRRITTIHSLTMGMTGIKPQDIVEIAHTPYKYNFCKVFDIQYDRNSDEDDMMDVPDDAGHMFFQMNGWLKSNMMDASEWKECPIASEWDNDEHDFEEVNRRWRAYKSDKGIYEFDDVIQLAVERNMTVDAAELFVDELQDLYPLQQAFLDNQVKVVDRVWLAGDDDQCIYGWAGANPDYFIDMDCQVRDIDDELWEDKSGYWAEDGVYILEQSYRMPAEIMNLSQACIQQVHDRQEKKFKPHNDGGNVTRFVRPTVNQIEDVINYDDTFILCRSNFLCQSAGKMLINAGIPFEDRFRTWRESTLGIRDAMAAMYNRQPAVDGQAAHHVVSNLSESMKSTDMKYGDAGTGFESRPFVDRQELENCIKTGRPKSRREMDEIIDDMDDINYFQKEGIINNVLEGKEDLQPEGITVETIHWSKGKEADTVILSLNTTGAVMENMGQDDRMPPAERRLYYVGMTRAENNLVLAEGLDFQADTFNVHDLFGEYWSKNYDQ